MKHKIIPDETLDNCAASPRVPKVGDMVRMHNEDGAPDDLPGFVVDVIGAEAVVRWRHDGGIIAEVHPLSDMTVVDE